MKIPKQAYTIEFKELAVKRIKDGQHRLDARPGKMRQRRSTVEHAFWTLKS